MPQLLKEFRLKVFDDGSTEMIECAKKDDFQETLNKGSQRIRQATLVIMQMNSLRKKNKEKEIDYSQLYNEAVNMVADNLSIERSTVHDKLERQMHLSAQNMKEILKDFFTTKKSDTLKDLLLNAVNKNNLSNDTYLIEQLFERLKF